MTLTIELPWPAKELNPNAREHWAKKARHVSKARQEAMLRAKAAVKHHGAPLADTDGLVHMAIVFNPPDKRRRDRDNIIASCKALMDGLSDAIGIDDSKFVPTYRMGVPVKHGRVVVCIPSEAYRASNAQRSAA